MGDHYNIPMYIDNLGLYELRENLKDTTGLGLKTEFKITNMGQLYWVLEIQITFNHHPIHLYEGSIY
jgi:hypothetical protein